MNAVKKYLGFVWFLLGPALIFFLIYGAVLNIDPAGKKDINNPVIWAIIIAIFSPIALGLMIFGFYAMNNEYHHLPKSSKEVED
ncbi:MAG: hypothetical protein E6H07_03550 [Bacteroidetes bacterium]|nr:MAG: hypothetical protein E6H07_03550 [Bacteroidota bacterium]